MKHANIEPIGSRVGPYEVVRHLATGGTATVYLARKADGSGFDKQVALKRIHPYLAKRDDFVDMFLDEARISARISHANVCPVFDFGYDDNTYYIAMEYIVGEPVARITSTLNRMPEARQSKAFYAICATIIADACEGLHAAHELRDEQGQLLNVVHRDVAPSNLFVAYNGSVRIVDFGFAKSTAKVHKTQDGMVKGTFGYMSPEQSNASPVDRRSDLWSIGVVLWELVTGKRLFQEANLRLNFDAIQRGPIPEAKDVDPAVPEALSNIISQCLQRNPANRWSSARQLSQELRHFSSTTGSNIGPAEIAAWMQFLFPSGVQEKRALAETTTDGSRRHTKFERNFTETPWFAPTMVGGVVFLIMSLYILMSR